MKAPTGKEVVGAITGFSLFAGAFAMGYLQKEPRANEILDRQRPVDLEELLNANCSLEDSNIATYSQVMDLLKNIQGELSSPLQLVVANEQDKTGFTEDRVLLLISVSKQVVATPLNSMDILSDSLQSICLES